jgi:DNA-binding NarL/FixJ family response regulator
VPEAKAAPQLLILAEPLLREGLVRLLEPSFRAAVEPESVNSSVQLVIWSAAGNLPLPTLQRELQQLRDRWQPAPLLLMVPGDCRYSSDQLLQLSCEGLLQQAEPGEIPEAVSTLLAGGRVVELRPLAAELPQPNRVGATPLPPLAPAWLRRTHPLDAAWTPQGTSSSAPTAALALGPHQHGLSPARCR